MVSLQIGVDWFSGKAYSRPTTVGLGFLVLTSGGFLNVVALGKSHFHNP